MKIDPKRLQKLTPNRPKIVQKRYRNRYLSEPFLKRFFDAFLTQNEPEIDKKLVAKLSASKKVKTQISDDPHSFFERFFRFKKDRKSTKDQ